DYYCSLYAGSNTLFF
nr:immunoglobulin light chain junction region [Macaca mulatta]